MRIICAGRRWALVLVIAAVAQPALLKAAPLERSDLDKSIYASLKDVINRGADLYNSGDPAACYHVYQGALLAIEALLDHYPDLQKEIKTALADAERNPDIRRRAYALRGTLDKVRATTNPKKPVATLWDRLGGEKNVTKIVDDFVAAVIKDPNVNLTRSGKFKLDDQKLATMKKRAVAFISIGSGGPIKYEGKPIKEAHQGMGITDAEFDAAAAHFKAALAKNGIKPADVKTAMDAVEATRKDIVEKK
ncbi:MAG TPA: group 1 truncated hemoglobin [Gemmataceae bacterium]|nr:group 1 truncated hemoglobin [Gemmataceae bacterium]